MRFAFACLAAVVIAAPAHGWNAKGHMVIARLVWLKLTPDQRATAVDILKSHPHYDEFLTADRPENIPEDQWVFLRSATWPDWVRNHHQAQFHRSQWHYVNLPYIPPGSDINAADHPPAPVNVMERIPYCVKMIRSGNQEDRAIHFCWLMHLVGDIHQPLHCVALFNAQFPDGDRGGNLAIVGVGRGQKNLHSFWDGIMGEKISLSEIGGTAAKIDEMVKSDPTLIGDDLANHPSPEEWAKEGLANAQKHVYLDGQLKVANTAQRMVIPDLPDDYAANAGRVARICAAKAATRLTLLVVNATESTEKCTTLESRQ